MNGNVETVQFIYKCFETGDIRAAMEAMSPDIVWYEAEHFPYADGNPYCGREDVRNNVIDRLYEEWSEFRQVVEAIFDAGEAVVMTGRYEGVFKRTGRRIEAQAVHIWRLKKGMPVEFRQYVDTLEVARATRSE